METQGNDQLPISDMESHPDSYSPTLDSTHEPGFSDAETIPGGILDISGLTLGDGTTHEPSVLSAVDAEVQGNTIHSVTGGSSTEGVNAAQDTDTSAAQALTLDNKSRIPTSKYPSKRAAMIAKAQAAKNGPIVSKQSTSERRSAQLKTSAKHYRPILAVGKVSKSRLEEMRKELADQKTQEEIEVEAEQAKLAQEHKNSLQMATLSTMYVQLLQSLPMEAYQNFPENFSQLSDGEKFKIVLRATIALQGQESKEKAVMQMDESDSELETNGEKVIEVLRAFEQFEASNKPKQLTGFVKANGHKEIDESDHNLDAFKESTVAQNDEDEAELPKIDTDEVDDAAKMSKRDDIMKTSENEGKGPEARDQEEEDSADHALSHQDKTA
ncbi:hypothetical protein N0V90_010927 [Kalmusia sp. IMI 367209]|nr:hypothetical protein N0V90_010927 [Kalmusia sp. IMI 367209]